MAEARPQTLTNATQRRRGAGKSLLLVGTGLIGGSFALAAKAKGLFDCVIGMDRNAQALEQARELGIVDATAQSIPANCAAVCVAVPVGGIAACVREAAAHAPLVFDVGSVKRPIVDALAPVPAHFVPCHPIAGSERAGPAAAHAELFQGHTVALTPVADTDAAAIAAVRGLWEAIGASVVVESPSAHDDRLALLSHLPHLVAFAFMEVAGNTESLHGGGGGFRDFTRIAAADADVWADILHANAPRLRPYLDQLIEALRGFATEPDSAALRQRISAAAEVKRALDAAEPCATERR